jgi:hypothetical protein
MQQEAAASSSSLSAPAPVPALPPPQAYTPDQGPDIYTQQVELRKLTNLVLDELDKMRKIVERSQDKALVEAYGVHIRQICALLQRQLDVLFALQDQQSEIVASVVAETEAARSTTLSAAVAALIGDQQRLAQEEQQQQQAAQRTRKLNRK